MAEIKTAGFEGEEELASRCAGATRREADSTIVFLGRALRPLLQHCFHYLPPIPVLSRYAAEAMHLSEEVRLLKAKLNAADDQLQDKLAQVRVALHMLSSRI